jgi:hypothetical protein
MKIYTLTKERIEDLENKAKSLQSELDQLKKTTIIQMWNSELEQIN